MNLKKEAVRKLSHMGQFVKTGSVDKKFWDNFATAAKLEPDRIRSIVSTANGGYDNVAMLFVCIAELVDGKVIALVGIYSPSWDYVSEADYVELDGWHSWEFYASVPGLMI